MFGPTVTAPHLDSTLRQAAPWLRKISATSSAGRGMALGDQAGRSLRLSSSESRSRGLITLRIVLVATRV